MPFRIIREDITRVYADAIVNTANPYPIIGGGTDRAIYEAAGKMELLEERQRIGEIAPGEVAATPAYGLHARFILHTVGPAWWGGDHGEYGVLASCYRKSLLLAEQLRCESIAFPLISTGVYGFPKDRALKVAMDEITRFLEKSEMLVILVVFDRKAYELSSSLVREVEKYIDDRYVAERKKAEYGPGGLEEDRRRRANASERRRRMHFFAPGRGRGQWDDDSDEFDAGNFRRRSASHAPFAFPEYEAEEIPETEEEAFAAEAAPEYPEAEEGASQSLPKPREEAFAAEAAPEYPETEEEAFGSLPVPREEAFAGSKQKGAGKKFPGAARERKRTLSEIMDQVGETFQETLFRLIDERGLTDVEVYKKANVDRKLFSKIRCNPAYMPKKSTAIAFAVALRLNMDETVDLLRRAGLAFSPSSRFDLIVEYCIENKKYNIVDINALLFRYDQPLLG